MGVFLTKYLIMANPKKTLKENDYGIISRLGERGVSETDICKALGMSYKTWQRIKEEDPRALDALEEARRVEESELVGVLFESATKDKNLTACMFLLKTRHGYLEGAQQVAANQVNVQITLPGAKDPVSYLKEVEQNES